MCSHILVNNCVITVSSNNWSYRYLSYRHQFSKLVTIRQIEGMGELSYKLEPCRSDVKRTCSLVGSMHFVRSASSLLSSRASHVATPYTSLPYTDENDRSVIFFFYCYKLRKIAISIFGLTSFLYILFFFQFLDLSIWVFFKPSVYLNS